MHTQTFRAATLHDALRLVRDQLGPQAEVLRTRDIAGGGLMRFLLGSRGVEVTASAGVAAMPQKTSHSARLDHGLDLCQPIALAIHDDEEDNPWGVACSQTPAVQAVDLPAHRDALSALLNAGFSPEVARDLLAEVCREETQVGPMTDVKKALAKVARHIERNIPIAGPIACPAGQRRLIALVGPTGVGKTTTIAKLAANFRLREKRRVGLITVDTYRIAAVEQLRTYADIIDLPMAVVSTPREMREAIGRLNDVDIVLLDTAGRGPHDDLKIQELRAMLQHARPDEVHLVLSSTTAEINLKSAARQFAAVGAKSLVLTKLDEATSLGNLLPVLQASKLPLSYLTDGQNVPSDIYAADARRLTQAMLKGCL